jgi:RNA polymerase sigma-70 factor, ECF subfamily
MPQDEIYEQATAAFGAALDRLARSYEADPDKRRDLLQEIHLALWRSLGGFGGQCSLRTWVYRVAHNVAASHVLRNRRAHARPLVGLDEIGNHPDAADADVSIDRQRTLERLHFLVQRLKPVDREVILLYLEELDAASIGEITGISPTNVATKIHRIKKVLTAWAREGGRDGQ